MRKTLKKQIRKNSKSRKKLSKILGGTRHAVYTLKPWMTAYSDRLVLSEVAKNPFGIQHLEHVGADMDRLLESICENPGDAAYGIIRKNMDTILSREPLIKALCKNINSEVTLLLKPKIEELLEAEPRIVELRGKFVALTLEYTSFDKEFSEINKELKHNKGLKRRKPELDARRDELILK
jgi:hypothetical protein